ncbi:MAG: aromatic amino acid lyase [Candidatus Heimdallarchaeota archaeon]|nr:aromatic amino acid lyase [Candidatus Heimdallarchaeota archaeon]
MTVILTGKDLTIEQMVAVARHNEKVELHPDAVTRINTCRAMLEEKVVAKEIMYGVNTFFYLEKNLINDLD